jgi:hypothetical protein
MTQKPKFKPVVTRVKLNPEQAVLFCNCYRGARFRSVGVTRNGSFCITRVGTNKCNLTAQCRSTRTTTNTS